MKIAYLFFNGQLRGSKKFYSNLIEKQEGDIYCADGGANIAYQLNLIPKEIYGDLDSIKDEVKEVVMGQECGIGIQDFNDIKAGDIIESYIMEEIPR